jgi:hypothetical protein
MVCIANTSAARSVSKSWRLFILRLSVYKDVTIVFISDHYTCLIIPFPDSDGPPSRPSHLMTTFCLSKYIFIVHIYSFSSFTSQILPPQVSATLCVYTFFPRVFMCLASNLGGESVYSMLGGKALNFNHQVFSFYLRFVLLDCK